MISTLKMESTRCHTAPATEVAIGRGLGGGRAALLGATPVFAFLDGETAVDLAGVPGRTNVADIKEQMIKIMTELDLMFKF